MDRHLQAFLAIADCGNLTQAAQQIGLAQPSLTKRLQLLEAELGTVLFQRQFRGMQLTSAGKVFYQHAKRIEQDHLQAKEALNALKAGHLDVLRIGAGPLFRHRCLPSVFAHLRREFPQTRLQLDADVHLKNLPLLKQGKLDVVFGAISNEHVDDRIDIQPMIHVELGLLASHAHPLAIHQAITAKQLIELQWILYSNDPETAMMVRGYFKRHGLSSPDFAIQTNSFEFGLTLVATGEYIMPAVRQMDLSMSHHGLTLLPMDEPIDYFPAGAYLRRSSSHYPVIQRLLTLVQQTLPPT